MSKKEYRTWRVVLGDGKVAYRFPNGDVGIYRESSKKCAVTLTAEQARRLAVKFKAERKD